MTQTVVYIDNLAAGFTKRIPVAMTYPKAIERLRAILGSQDQTNDEPLSAYVKVIGNDYILVRIYDAETECWLAEEQRDLVQEGRVPA
ncbi:MAG: hypothetical protein NTW96_24735 [Planctomycetia bacterium]|nr:hypothetical protein [Planctomycetia bacterium]